MLLGWGGWGLGVEDHDKVETPKKRKKKKIKNRRGGFISF